MASDTPAVASQALANLQAPNISTPNNVQVTERLGSIFDAPAGSVLIHACNCQGVWGAGVANVFKLKYPQAFNYYHDHCVPPRMLGEGIKAYDKRVAAHKPLLVGKALLIRPQPGTLHWIACLFTSRHYGRRKDEPNDIVQRTRDSLADLKSIMMAASADPAFGDQLFTVRMNTGLFNVPWEATRRAIFESGLNITVMNDPSRMPITHVPALLNSMEMYGQDLQKVQQRRRQLPGYRSPRTSSGKESSSAHQAVDTAMLPITAPQPNRSQHSFLRQSPIVGQLPNTNQHFVPGQDSNVGKHSNIDQPASNDKKRSREEDTEHEVAEELSTKKAKTDATLTEKVPTTKPGTAKYEESHTEEAVYVKALEAESAPLNDGPLTTPLPKLKGPSTEEEALVAQLNPT